jgi:hypothetical protein
MFLLFEFLESKLLLNLNYFKYFMPGSKCGTLIYFQLICSHVAASVVDPDPDWI